MAKNSQTDLSALIGKCECAIRRGTVPQSEKLQTLQQHLLSAQDAPDQLQTEEQLQTAIQYYVEQIPKDVRQSELISLTDAFEQICDSLNVDGKEVLGANVTADD